MCPEIYSCFGWRNVRCYQLLLFPVVTKGKELALGSCLNWQVAPSADELMRASLVVDLCPVSLKSPCPAIVTQQAKLWLVWSHVCAGSSARQCCCWSEVMPEISQPSHWTECLAAAFQLPASKAAEFLKQNVKPLFLGGDSLSAIAEVAGEWQVVRHGGRKGFLQSAGERWRKRETEALIRMI